MLQNHNRRRKAEGLPPVTKEEMEAGRLSEWLRPEDFDIERGVSDTYFSIIFCFSVTNFASHEIFKENL